MKAIWFKEQGACDVLQYGDIDCPEPAAGEVLVQIRASGVNPSDVKTRMGARGAMPFPCQIPHSDGAGVINAVGEGVADDRIGERVWLWNSAINRANGTCAEAIALPSKQAVLLDDATDFLAGACFGVPLMTAACAVSRCMGNATTLEGKTVLITAGAGAVGFYAVQLARLLGAKVITTISSEPKATHVTQAQPHCIINYKSDDVVDCIGDFTDKQGVDAIIDVEFGANLPITEKIIKSGACIVSYGSVAQPTPSLPFYPLMFKNTTIQLVFIYSITPTERQRVLALITQLQSQLIHAVAQVLPLEQTAQAHAIVESGKAIGNVVVAINQE